MRVRAGAQSPAQRVLVCFALRAPLSKGIEAKTAHNVSNRRCERYFFRKRNLVVFSRFASQRALFRSVFSILGKIRVQNETQVQKKENQRPKGAFHKAGFTCR